MCISRSSESDPENEPRQPSLGSSPHSRRIAEDWNRGVASHGRQVHGPASEAALPNLANLSQKSRQGLGFCRLLRFPTITFQLLFVFVILDHDRRRPIHFAVTSNPTAEWTARQLLQAFPWDHAPRYLLRDRDRI